MATSLSDCRSLSFHCIILKENYFLTGVDVLGARLAQGMVLFELNVTTRTLLSSEGMGVRAASECDSLFTFQAPDWTVVQMAWDLPHGFRWLQARNNCPQYSYIPRLCH